MKKIMLMISMIILLCACGTNKEELKEKKGITSVTCEKALDLQANQGVIIDVREKDEYEESHLEGAINIPYTEIVNKIEDVVDDKEYRLTCKEIVIEQSHEGDAQCEPALFTAVDVFLHSDEREREESGNVLKVVEEDIVYLEAGESVEQSACKSGIL